MGRGDPAGGSEALGQLIDQHGEALYRDFLTYYGISLPDFLAGEVRCTPRLLLSLLDRFPEGSEYNAELLGGREHRDWGVLTWIAAAIANNVHVNTMVVGNIPLNKRKEFHMIEGPKGPARPKKKGSRIAALMAVFAKD